jgi:hypothetical protein
MYTENLRIAAFVAAGVLLAAAPALAQSAERPGQGQAVVTVMPEHGDGTPASVSQQQLTLKVDGKQVAITGWQPLQGANDGVELVFLIDQGARASLDNQLDDVANFIKSLPPNTRATIGYMENGRAALTGPLSTDRAQILRGLHVPAGSPGIDASPYFCLSDLAKHWPSQDQQARREVVMISDGVDNYDRRYDPDDPYLQSAITDSVRAHMIVYSIYWRNMGRLDRSLYETNAGQNLLLEVTQATGGKSYWEGIGNPVSIDPYLGDIRRRLNNQYELSFAYPIGHKPEVESMKLKVNGVQAKVDAPQQVFVGRAPVPGL